MHYTNQCNYSTNLRSRVPLEMPIVAHIIHKLSVFYEIRRMIPDQETGSYFQPVYPVHATTNFFKTNLNLSSSLST